MPLFEGVSVGDVVAKLTYLSKSTDTEVLPQNELTDLNRSLLHGEIVFRK